VYFLILRFQMISRLRDTPSASKRRNFFPFFFRLREENEKRGVKKTGRKESKTPTYRQDGEVDRLSLFPGGLLENDSMRLRSRFRDSFVAIRGKPPFFVLTLSRSVHFFRALFASSLVFCFFSFVRHFFAGALIVLTL
jgi:hypothetical protein